MKKLCLLILLFVLVCIHTTDSWAKYNGKRNSWGLSGNISYGNFYLAPDEDLESAIRIAYGGDLHYTYRFSKLYALRIMAGFERLPKYFVISPVMPSADLTNIFYLGSDTNTVTPYLGIGIGIKGLHGNAGARVALNHRISLFTEISAGSNILRTTGQFTTGLQYDF